MAAPAALRMRTKSRSHVLSLLPSLLALWICIRSGVTASAVRLPEGRVIKMSAPSMEERKACWGARDEYWTCLDENMEDASRCQKLRCSFESRCPQQWVKYFDKRRDFLKYKEQLQAGEYQPPGTTEKS
ncbi:cytochrome c oxidase assembly factor 6 homolog isoform X2 [Emys orbicularis]|uniref:cytochrome c oxidase assembly factor 6 homolog isoform X2 n=2 Tax=Emys orbicularis TaxID=82168 RepID=UPI0031FDA301